MGLQELSQGPNHPLLTLSPPSETYLPHYQMHLKFAPEWGIFFAWKVWCNTGIFRYLC
jgi:hypothetical protein